jgi:hypothetical protein
MLKKRKKKKKKKTTTTRMMMTMVEDLTAGAKPRLRLRTSSGGRHSALAPC